MANGLSLTGQVGPVQGADSSNLIIRQGKTGEGIVGDLHGRYYEATSRQKVFSSLNSAGTATTAGLSATSTVFTLYNPAGSQTLLSLIDVQIALSAAPSGAALIYLVYNNNPTQAAPATVTALTIVCNYLSSVTGVAKVYSAATLASVPLVLRLLGYIPAASNNTSMYIKDEVAGAVVIQPGTYISVQANIAVNTLVGMTWEEIPLL